MSNLSDSSIREPSAAMPGGADGACGSGVAAKTSRASECGGGNSSISRRIIIPRFGHHVLSLIPSSGHPRALRASASGTAAKEEAPSAERINGAVKFACRVESVFVSPEDGLLSSHALQPKLASAAWSTIRNTTSLRWIVLTTNPESIPAALPADWLGKGYRNVCFGTIVSDPASFPEIARHLSDIPCHFRMALFPSVPSVDEIRDHIGGIQWIVVVGDDGEEGITDELRSSCQSAETSFLFIRRDGTLPEPPAATGPAQWSEHPFGSELQLRRPTLSDLRLGDPFPLMLDDGPTDLATHESADNNFDEEPGVTIHQREATELNPVDRDDPPAVVTTIQEEATTLLPVAHEHEDALISEADRRDFSRLDTTARRYATAFVECGLALAEIHDRKLWRAGDHPTWEGYVRCVLGMSKPHAHRLVQAARIATKISETLPTGNAGADHVRPASESQIRPLCRLKDAGQRATAWSRAIQRAEGQPTAKVIGEVVSELMAENPRSCSPRVNSKQQLQDKFRELRATILQGLPTKQITGLLDELESILKLS